MELAAAKPGRDGTELDRLDRLAGVWVWSCHLCR